MLTNQLVDAPRMGYALEVKLPEDVSVRCWNREQLADMGFGMEINDVADQLDYREVKNLLTAGCPRHLVPEILV